MRPNAETRAQPTPDPRAGAFVFAAGVVFLLVSVVTSLLLVLQHFGGLALPGCGEGSACAEAARSAWGKVPGIGWPVSHLGLAYFLAVLVMWIVVRGAVPRGLRYLVRFGVLISLAFCAVILIKWMVCKYCVAAHVGNFAFWITMELVRGRSSAFRRAALLTAFLFVDTTIVLGVLEWVVRAKVSATAEADRTTSVQQMIERSRLPEKPTPPTTSSTTPPSPATHAADPKSGSSAVPAVAPATMPASASPPVAQTYTPDAPFIGRYPHGPLEAPIRIVMFTGYQCPDCLSIERQVDRLLSDPNICISIKHFPFNSDCNPNVGRSMQPNGCWAAYAAEAAGILWGAEGFWKMHKWLFARRGVFQTVEELEGGIRELGYDPAGFVNAMNSEEVKRRVREDCAEAERLGLHFTPMIFINGVELKGWGARDALLRTVDQVLATNPPPRSAAHDQPPLAIEKYVADWRDQPVQQFPPDQRTWRLGPADAAIDIVVWADYEELHSSRADKRIRDFVAGRKDARYTFRHFPFGKECNPTMTDDRHPHACAAARAAEAAGTLAGADGYWRMHAWLMDHWDKLGPDSWKLAATELGLDPAALLAAMERQDVKDAVTEDLEAGRKLPRLRYGVPPGIFGIPSVFVNGKWIPRTILGDHDIVKLVLEEAAAAVAK